MERSQTGQLDSIAEQEAPHSNGDLPVQEHALENGHSDAAQDSEQYETLTFHVGGRLTSVLSCLMSASLLERVLNPPHVVPCFIMASELGLLAIHASAACFLLEMHDSRVSMENNCILCLMVFAVRCRQRVLCSSMGHGRSFQGNCADSAADP